jgi:hypothetical protein
VYKRLKANHNLKAAGYLSQIAQQKGTLGS